MKVGVTKAANKSNVKESIDNQNKHLILRPFTARIPIIIIIIIIMIIILVAL